MLITSSLSYILGLISCVLVFKSPKPMSIQRLFIIRILFYSTLLLPFSLPAQDTFVYTYGGSGDDIGTSITPTADGGFLIAGSSNSFSQNGDTDVYVAKLDACGQLEWEKTYGSEGEETQVFLDITSTGFGLAFITTGYQNTHGQLMSLNETGDIIWAKLINPEMPKDSVFITMTAQVNEDLRIFYSYFNNTLDDYGFWHMGWNSQDVSDGGCGGISASIYFNDHRPTKVTSIHSYLGDYMACGQTQLLQSDAFIFYLSANVSASELIRSFGGSGQETANDMLIVGPEFWGGGIMTTVGSTTSSGVGLQDIYLTRISYLEWQEVLVSTFGGSGIDVGTALEKTKNDDLLILGYTESFGINSRDILLMKIDSSNTVLWANTYGTSGFENTPEIGNTLHILPDSSIVFIGTSEHPISGDKNIYVVKTDQNGNTNGCQQTAINIVKKDTIHPTFSYFRNTWVDPCATNITISPQTISATSTNQCYNFSRSPDTTICIGNSVALQANGGIAYQWSPSNTLSDPSIPNPMATPNQSTSYTVTITDPQGCPFIDSVYIEVIKAEALLTFTDTTICPNSTVSLQASGGIAYEWSPSNYMDDPFSANPSISPLQTGIYTVTVTNAHGCQDTASLQVQVASIPSVLYTSDTTLEFGQSLTLLGNPDLSYQWTLPTDLDDPFSHSPTASPQQTISYTATATDQWGCTYTQNINIRVIPLPTILLPTAFSPNNDGINDTFKPILHRHTLVRFAVYNRWGNKIFETSDPQQAWDGTDERQQQPIGAYVYVVEYREATSAEIIFKSGSVLLIE